MASEGLPVECGRVAQHRQHEGARDSSGNGRQSKTEHGWPVCLASDKSAFEQVVEEMDRAVVTGGSTAGAGKKSANAGSNTVPNPNPEYSVNPDATNATAPMTMKSIWPPPVALDAYIASQTISGFHGDTSCEGSLAWSNTVTRGFGDVCFGSEADVTHLILDVRFIRTCGLPACL